MSTATGTTAFETYQRVRDEVVRMKSLGARLDGHDAPSRYWSEELENFDYMIEASPLVIRKLRHHAFHITGLRPYDYRNAREQQANFERRLRALVDLGSRDLLVPENPALGGFGFDIDGALYNVDTLKFFEVLTGMWRSGLLARFDEGSPRRLVWEIGGGWGGFAYQFKTLRPNTTYAIVDFPELFLFSATYLGTVFPDARMYFWGDHRAIPDWRRFDFMFIPNTAARDLLQTTPDLLVNLVSFQEMTKEQVDAYARLAAEAGCPAVYSLNRDRSPYNAEIESVTAVLRPYYELREVRLLDTEYTKATKKDSVITPKEAAARAKQVNSGEAAPYRHHVGTLRSDRTRVGIGATLFNRAPYLRQALDSILAQSFTEFRLVLVDDGSTDETGTIGREYAARDPRVTYVRNDPRLGMVGAWRRAFEEATRQRGIEYFAWASDHDVWDRDWLQNLVAALDRDPDTVLAYPFTQRIGMDGAVLSKPVRLFETAGLRDVRQRWVAFSGSRSVAAGDMVYGLMRAQAVREAGIFRDVFAPDRLLAAELTIRGQIRQVPQLLWYRRQFETGSVARQRHTLFTPGSSPRSSVLPTWLQHARVLWRTYASSQATPLGESRAQARRLVLYYAATYALRHHRKTTVHRRFARLLEAVRFAYKRAKHFVLLAVFYTLVYGRRAFWGSVYYVLVGLRRVTGRPASR